ncbi:AMP-binding enzyme family protein [Rhodococcus sp. MTM3W5.2]|uniref:AMP-dependent synthetase/ligase n=1 Tax=Rhodococcus sp. MTM3W5.2 TaxID=1805827 RepID=UPI0009795DD5|nr:long-chain fatty acid--CoA ligase [Rhodococcus sp. MTM3W5.2]AQA25014.1 AMP-binding enzyme family protein [Rhodococcus sp. MTM3W5.2]
MNTSNASPQTLCEAFQTTAATYPDAVALRTPGDGVVITWRLYAERVRRIAAGLAKLGVRHRDTVGLMLTNRPEFHLLDTAALHAGATPFSVYNMLAAEQLNYVLTNAGNKVMICEEQFLPVLRDAIAGTAVERIVCVDGDAEDTTSLRDLEANGDRDFDFEASWRAVEPDDLLTIIYTSGTTGPPKGVELTHANILAEYDAVRDIANLGPADRYLSYLPDAHIANRLFHYGSLKGGIQITTLADAKQAVTALPDVRPTVLLAVPQVWYKLKAAIELALIDEPSTAKRRLADWAIGLGRRKVRLESDQAPVPRTLRIQHAVADRLVLGSVRAKLGLDQVRVAISAAAALSPDTLEFVLGLGIPCVEAWGLSETTGGVTVNRPDAIRIGTVGRAVKGAVLRLAEDGELLVSGPVVMKGYRNDPAKTAEALDPDGWLHTGDIATIDADGYVTIVDRKKELIINAGGKNMSPSNIEGTIRAASSLIGGAVVIGNDRPYVVALLTLDPDAAAAFATRNGIHNGSPGDLASNPVVRAEIDSAIASANAKLSRVEQVKKFTLLAAIWEPGGDEFTPTMKLRRKPIDAKYAREIEELYAG